MLPFLSKNNLFFYFFIERDTLNGRECHVRDTECLAPGSFCAKVLHPSRVSRPVGLPGRPGEFRPEPPTDPDVNLSIHPARATQRRLPPSIKTRSSSGYPLTPSRRGWPAPFAPRELPRFLATTKQCAPDRCIGTFGLVGSPLVPFPFASPTRFSSSVRKPG